MRIKKLQLILGIFTGELILMYFFAPTRMGEIDRDGFYSCGISTNATVLYQYVEGAEGMISMLYFGLLASIFAILGNKQFAVSLLLVTVAVYLMRAVTDYLIG